MGLEEEEVVDEVASKENRFDRERERGPQIDTWTNETAENAEKENSSKCRKRLGYCNGCVDKATDCYPKFT